MELQSQTTQTPASLRKTPELEKGLNEAKRVEAPSKPRIDTLDSLRFFLIAYIASGHFIKFASDDDFVQKLIRQVNVVVGAFFVISGYVSAYTTTELGERKYSAKRLDDAVGFFVSRIMSFWPLHFLVLLLFSPMFFWVDYVYSGTFVAVFHGLISTFLLQAWFPLGAEMWNAPTWFLSSLAFCFMVLPHALKVLAGQTKPQLRRTLVILTCLSLTSKFGYSYDMKAFNLWEGSLNAKSHPNYALFNSRRFSPLAAVLEVLMGATACRLVMLDTEEETNNTGSSLLPLLGVIGVIVLRTMGLLELNGMLLRAGLFLPSFIVFLMRLHRETVGRARCCNPVVQLLNVGVLKWLGSISFPIFVVHGPVGQMFYKKKVAQTLFGGSLSRFPGHFAFYWLVVIALSALLNKCFLQRAWFSTLSKKLSAILYNLLKS